MSTAVVVDDHRWQWDKDAPENVCKLSPLSAHVQQYTSQEMCERYRNEYLRTIKILLQDVEKITTQLAFTANLEQQNKYKTVLKRVNDAEIVVKEIAENVARIEGQQVYDNERIDTVFNASKHILGHLKLVKNDVSLLDKRTDQQNKGLLNRVHIVLGYLSIIVTLISVYTAYTLKRENIIFQAKLNEQDIQLKEILDSPLSLVKSWMRKR